MFAIVVIVTMITATLVLISFLPVTFRASYRRRHGEDKIVVETSVLGGFIHYRLVIPVVELTRRTALPWVETEIESQSGEMETHAVEEQSVMRKSLKNYVANPHTLYLDICRLVYWVNKYRYFIDILARRMRCQKFRWVTCVGVEDAAVTGVVVGLLWAVKGVVFAKLRQLSLYIDGTPTISVTPCFDRTYFSTDFECILSTRIGYIIGAGLHLLFCVLRERRR